MTTPLDRDLAERLERLAAAVPVRPTQLDPVHAGAVRSRQRVRMAWLTPLVALVLLALVAGIIGIGSIYVLNGPISATTRFGDFTLALSSTKAHYRTGEPVVISASLTFDGGAEQVQISHAGSGPLGFGIREPVHGYTLEPAWRQSCRQAQLVRGVAMEQPFAKSGGDAGHADPAAFTRFMTDPSLDLSSGTWHPYVVAEFSHRGCGGALISMRAELAIEVEDQPQATAPSPTAIPEDVAIHIVNLDPGTVEIEFRNRAVAWLACGQSIVISVNQLDSAPPWTFIARGDDGKTIDAATLDWHLPAGIVIRDGAALKGAWPMSYGPASSACDAEAQPSPS
jgi:hypothetical protein